MWDGFIEESGFVAARLKLLRESFVSAAYFVLVAYLMTYVFWFFLWVRSVLPGRNGEIFGHRIYAIWDVQWQYHPTILLCYVSVGLVIACVLWSCRYVRMSFDGK